MSSNYSISLLGPSPWGFRLQGGKDFNMPLTISRLTDGGKAAKAHISVGDVVLSIDGITTDGMNHLEAQNKIKACAGNLYLTLQKASSLPKPAGGPKEAAVTKVPRRPIIDTDIGFFHVPTHSDASRKRIIEDTEDWRPRSGTSQSRSFRILAQITGTENEPRQEADTGNKTKVSKVNLQIAGPKYNKLRDWHHGMSASTLNVQGTESEHGQVREEPSDKSATEAPLLLCNGTTAKETNTASTGDHARTSEEITHNPPSPPGSVSAEPEHLALALCAGFDQSTGADADSTDQPPLDGGGISGESLNPSRVVEASAGSDESSGQEEAKRASTPVPDTISPPEQVSSLAPDQMKISPTPPSLKPVHSPAPLRRELLLNPLEFLPRGAPCPPHACPSAPSARAAQLRDKAPIVSGPQASGLRPSDGGLCQSLLDALLITPITKNPPLRLRKKKRPSATSLGLSKSKRVSWHQSVIDPNDPSLSSPVNAIYIFSEEVEEPYVNTHGTCAVKTMVKGPAVSPRNTNSATTQALADKSRGQVGLITPTFGGPNSSPKGPVKDRPVPQPHPKDEDSLVQRAEYFPAGTRTPVCAQCDKVIRGPFLVAMGNSWHPEEFNCTHCHNSLADIGFVEEQGSVYCEHCYEEFFAPICSRCQGKILGEVINALKQTWHVHCFLCASCQQPIRNNTFHLEDGEPYCERDYYNLFGTSCHGCDFPIEAGDKFLEALGFTWHDTCFVCAVCCTSLESQTFFSKKDKLLCKKHANTVKI
ncbi:PDZ and LIM domain protein 5a isoform X2 [Clupea harengus]|uniref:PDZ and LIM domain protein 5a isoform X2 n=1 Tax=Clupea harengus TaxID=7950 RepID=A0A8M1KP70_CLUHA|nr:PDZ and LIM domain protein 5a isoform X2 [Clupea harengus]